MLGHRKEVKEYRRLLKKRYGSFDSITRDMGVWQRFLVAFSVITKQPLNVKGDGDVEICR